MKYSVLALFSLSLLWAISCQNNSSPSTEGTDTADAPAADAPKLNEQILTELFEGRSLARKYDSTFQQQMVLVKSMKSSWSLLNEANQGRVRKIHEDIMKFTNPYEEIQLYTTQLDSLSAQLTSGRIQIPEAQKEFVKIRAQLKTSKTNLPLAPVDLEKNKAAFDAIFTEANKKASGAQ